MYMCSPEQTGPPMLIHVPGRQHAFTLDLRQLARFLALTLMTTPPNYMWQQYLERTFPAHPSRLSRHSPGAKENIELKSLEEAAVPPPQPGAGSGGGDGLDRPARLNVRNTLAKWFIDCIVVGAIANTVAFLLIMGLLKGQPGAQIWRNVETVSCPSLASATQHSLKQIPLRLSSLRKPSPSSWLATKCGPSPPSSASPSSPSTAALSSSASSACSGAYT